MGRIPDAFIREVLDRSDLREIIARHVKLTKSGSSYKGLCPFHNEKTPSFYVHPDKHFYHCFGCSAHGNALDFLMHHEQLPFLEALERLATDAGLDIPRSEALERADQKRRHLNDQLSEVQRFFTQHLAADAKAKHYLVKVRGLSVDLIKQFGLGYAPSHGQLLVDTFGKEAMALLLETGLVSERNGRYYARFRDRITFPIRDERGRLVAFGARGLSADAKPKYLNTVFDKHLYLYGLPEALAAKHPSKILIVVEGYLDVLMMAEHGLPNAVAGLGTAIGPKQVKLLFRYSQKIVFCFDGDRAGYAAAEKALKSTLSVLSDGIEVKFVFLPDGEDPDSILRKQGRTALMRCFQEGLTLEAFFFEALKQHYPSETLAHQASRGKLGVTWLEGMPNGLMKHLLMQRLADGLAIDAEAVDALLPATYEVAVNNNNDLRVLNPLQYLLSLVLQNPKEAALWSVPEWLMHSKHRDCVLLRDAIECAVSSSVVSAGALVEHWRGKADEAYIKQLAFWQHLSGELDWQHSLADALRQAELFWVTEHIEALLAQARLGALAPEQSEQLVGWMKRKNQLKSTKA